MGLFSFFKKIRCKFFPYQEIKNYLFIILEVILYGFVIYGVVLIYQFMID